MVIRKKTILKLTIEKENEGWFVIDPNNGDQPSVGPYSTKAEASEAKKGLEKFWHYYHDRSPAEIQEYEEKK